MYSPVFWKDLLERAGTTGVQALLALMVADGVFDVMAFDWGNALTVTLSAVALSVVKSLAAGKMGDGSASLARVTSPNPPYLP